METAGDMLFALMAEVCKDDYAQVEEIFRQALFKAKIYRKMGL